MRSVLFVSALALSTAACAHAQPAPTRSIQDAAAQPRIVIGEQSNVCVSVTVDQRVWPIPKLAETDSGLSGILAAELRQLYERQGGSSFIPNPGPRSGPRPEPRFSNNNNRSNPICRDAGEDIYVTASYVPRPDGTPFVFNYRIEQGAAVRSGSFSRDIEEEWRSGRLVRIHKQEPLQIAVGNDLRSRAEFLLSQLTDREGQ